MVNNKTQFLNSREEIVEWLDKNYVKNYTINDDLSVDVNGDVILPYKNLKFIPVNFDNVTGSFYCSNNHLVSLVGSPKFVGGSFYCVNNQLVNLTGSPESVGKSFSCVNNKLISLTELINCDFKEEVYFNIDEKIFKQKELIKIFVKYYSKERKYYAVTYNAFNDTIKPILQKIILKQKLNKSKFKQKTKKVFI